MNAVVASKRKIFVALLAGLGLVLALVAQPVSADMSVQLDEVVQGEPGSVATVAESPVDAALVGQECVASAVVNNQESANPDTDLLITTDGSTVEIADVEAVANGQTSTSAPVVMGDTVSVQVRIGPSGIASLGFSLSFECKPPATPPAKPVVETPTYTG